MSNVPTAHESAFTAVDVLAPHRRFRPVRVVKKTATTPPIGLFGAFALILMVESAVISAGPRFLDPVAYCWSLAEADARLRAPGCEVLLVGDSLVKHGLAPRVLSAVTHRPTWNLAVAAGPAPATEALLRRALDSGARPKAVVFDLKPGLLAGGPKFALRYWPQILSPSETLRLIRAARSTSFAAELIVTTALPTFRSRHEIRGDLSAALAGATGPLRDLNALGARHWSVNGGANLATPRADYSGDVTEADHKQFLSQWFAAHRVNAAAARRVAALACRQGSKAYLLLPPTVPKLMERRLATGTEAKYEAFVRSLQAEFPSLIVLDARASGYPPSAFVDQIHLSVTGALALSDDVAQVLRHDLDAAGPSSSGRWVRLPEYRERPLPDDLEHVELSRARLIESRTR